MVMFTCVGMLLAVLLVTLFAGIVISASFNNDDLIPWCAWGVSSAAFTVVMMRLIEIGGI